MNVLLLRTHRIVYVGKLKADRTLLLDGYTQAPGLRIPSQSLGALPHALRRIVETPNPDARGKESTRDAASIPMAELVGQLAVANWGVRRTLRRCLEELMMRREMRETGDGLLWAESHASPL